MAASQETLRRVKEKYPEYRDIPDAELSTVLISKYPEYDESPSTESVPPPTIGERVKALGIGAAEAVGRWPGELMSVAAEMGKQQLLGPIVSRIPGLSQAITASTEAALQPFQNLTPKAFNTLSEAIGSDVRYDDPNNPQFKAPYFAAAGEFIPNAASLFIRGPTGVRPAQTIAEVGKEVGSMASTAARTAKVAPREIFEAAFPKVAARTAPATPQQTAMAALDFELPQVERHIPIVTKHVSELVKKTPKTADEALSFINQAEDTLYKGRTAINKQAAEQGLVAKGDQALAEAKAILDDIPTISDDAKNAIMRDLEPIYRGDKTPQQGQALQQRLNKEFDAQYANGTFDKANPLNEARLAIRDSFARQMDEINRVITGSNETPYSDIGSLIEVRGGLQTKLRKLQGAEAAAKTGIEKAPTAGRVSTTKAGLRSQVAKKVITPFQKSQLEKLDDAVQTIFTPSGRRVPPRIAPTVEEIDVLRGTYSPSQAPVQTLEQLIEQRIATYPANIRNDPRIANAVARQQLLDEGVITP